MPYARSIFRPIALLGLLTLSACGAAPEPPEPNKATELGSSPVTLYKTATCGCCKKWAAHLETAGLTVNSVDVDRTTLQKKATDAGVPAQLTSCHLAVVDGYAVEGHVPADVVKRLIEERPAIAGIGVAGMPQGSPGMEHGGVVVPYTVEAFDKDGKTSVYAEIAGSQ